MFTTCLHILYEIHVKLQENLCFLFENRVFLVVFILLRTRLGDNFFSAEGEVKRIVVSSPMSPEGNQLSELLERKDAMMA